MAIMTKEKLELSNQALRDVIRAAVCVLKDETLDEAYKAGYTAELLSIEERIAAATVQREKFYKIEIWRIQYFDGTVGYKLYSKQDAIKDAEKKKEMYGGSYTIEEVV